MKSVDPGPGKAAARFVRPLAGRNTINGVGLNGLSPARRVALGLRRVFQQEMVVNELTLRDNVQAIADHVVRDRKMRREEVDRALEFVGLTGGWDRQGRTLNLFERRMVEIAKTLVGQPKVVLMDEPGARKKMPLGHRSLWMPYLASEIATRQDAERF